MSDQPHQMSILDDGETTTVLHDINIMVRKVYYTIQTNETSEARAIPPCVEVKCNEEVLDILDEIRERNTQIFSGVDDMNVLIKNSEGDELDLGLTLGKDIGTRDKPLLVSFINVGIGSQGTIFKKLTIVSVTNNIISRTQITFAL
jgi:hypothetical protein